MLHKFSNHSFYNVFYVLLIILISRLIPRPSLYSFIVIVKPSASEAPKKNAGEVAVEQFYQKAEAKLLQDQITEFDLKLKREQEKAKLFN